MSIGIIKRRLPVNFGLFSGRIRSGNELDLFAIFNDLFQNVVVINRCLGANVFNNRYNSLCHIKKVYKIFAAAKVRINLNPASVFFKKVKIFAKILAGIFKKII